MIVNVIFDNELTFNFEIREISYEDLCMSFDSMLKHNSVIELVDNCDKKQHIDFSKINSLILEVVLDEE